MRIESTHDRGARLNSFESKITSEIGVGTAVENLRDSLISSNMDRYIMLPDMKPMQSHVREPILQNRFIQKEKAVSQMGTRRISPNVKSQMMVDKSQQQISSHQRAILKHHAQQQRKNCTSHMPEINHENRRQSADSSFN